MGVWYFCGTSQFKFCVRISKNFEKKSQKFKFGLILMSKRVLIAGSGKWEAGSGTWDVRIHEKVNGKRHPTD